MEFFTFPCVECEKPIFLHLLNGIVFVKRATQSKKINMRTLMRSLAILIVVVMAFSLNSQAQTAKSFTGTVTYTITYTGANLDANTLASLPKITTVKIMGNKQRTETAFGPATIYSQNDGDKKESLVMIDAMGVKQYFKLNSAEIEEDYSKNGTPEIVYSDETKTVAGYVCKKASYTTKDEDDNTSTVTIYYTEELGGEALNYGSNLQGLKGFPLEFTVASNEITATYSASEVKKGKVKDVDFLIPSDFVECTPEEKAQYRALFNGEQ
jgi:GLPGLI family protein